MCAGLRIDPGQANFYLEQARGDIKEAIRLQSALPPHGGKQQWQLGCKASPTSNAVPLLRAGQDADWERSRRR